MHTNFDSDSDDELPPGWQQRPTANRSVYFINTLSKKIQWTHPVTGKRKIIPKELPFGWTESVDEEGQTIFIQQDTGSISVIDPRLAFCMDEKMHTLDFRQRFDSSSTAYQVLHGINLCGKYALITGCNSGIGYETAKTMASHGCKILLANRNIEATEKAIEEIVKETKANSDNLIPIHLDLSSLKSVKKCALAVRTLFSDHLDFLILNAGVFGLPYTETEDRLETTFQVNHLSQMYLALLLEPLLKKGSKVAFVSSESHRFANLKNVFVRRNLSMTKNQYSSMMAYNNSKLYNIITAKILSNSWQKKGIWVNALHPGNMVYTNLSKSWWLFRLAFFFVRPFTKSLQQAASTTIYVVAAPEIEGVSGLYFNNCFPCRESTLACDSKINREIFKISLQMIVKKMGREHIELYLDELESNDPK